MPRWALPAAESEEQSSSDEEEEAENGAPEADSSSSSDAEDEQQAGPSGAAAEEESAPAGKQKIKISLSKTGQVCHVCGKKGHNAGFVGAAYVDCPNRPCYLCKLPGHTTATCPYRFAPDQAAPTHSGSGLLASMRLREHCGRHERMPQHVTDWQVDAAVLRLHSRRCTCLEFHPLRDNLVLSGDKKGQVAIWDWQKVYERQVYTPHKALTNNIRFLPAGDGMSCCTASSDGLLKQFDCETGVDLELLDLNPEGWIPGVTDEKKWRMLYGMDVCSELGLVIAGDSHGYIHIVDPRTKDKLSEHLVHKKGNKVNSVHCNPVDPNIFVTASNDWTARLFDMRMLPSEDTHVLPKGKEADGRGFELAVLSHSRLVNSAYFSPVSGHKLLTTCIDNRLRVWDTWLGGTLEPSREIIHSHDFNRYLTPFRAEWDPKDPLERLIVIGRYISEDYGGLALHPVDLMDAQLGHQLAALTDPNLATISPVNKPHPRQDVIVSGSSRSLYAWRPTPEVQAAQSESSKASSSTQAASMPVGSSSYMFFDSEHGRRGDADSDDEGDGKKKKKRGASGKTKEDLAKRKKKG